MVRYAIVDLEATDARRNKIKIIQVGIVICENGRIVDQYSTDVNPHEQLSYQIKRLTGLDDERLQKAPSFRDVAPEINQLLKDSVFVAHNVKFDYNLLRRSMEEVGYSLKMPAADTVELARVFFPTLTRYGLDALDSALGLKNTHPHAAGADAMATAKLLLRIQERIAKLPRAVVNEILRHADNLLFNGRLIIEEAAKKTRENPQGLVIIGNIATKKRPKFVLRRRRLAENFDENIRALGLGKRVRQAELANLIKKDLENQIPSFIEAQTGIGKTYAYLLPLLASGRKIVLSTPTKILQNQLMTEVANHLSNAFSVSTTKLLGQTNYISLEKFSRLLQRVQDGKNFEIFKMMCLVWLTETDTGELEELSKIMSNKAYFESVGHDGVVKSDQLHVSQDFYQEAKRLAEVSDLVVVNHAYLAQHLITERDFLTGKTLIVDEAHALLSVLEAARQERMDVVDKVLELRAYDSKIKRRLIESLLFQMGSETINPRKMKLDAEELGLMELAHFLRDPSKLYWAEANTLASSPREFYDFQKLIPNGTKALFISSGLSFSEEQAAIPELLGYETYNFYRIPEKRTKNQRLFVQKDGTDVKENSTQAYARFVAGKIQELSKLKQPILVLFTAQLMLDWTGNYLEEAGIEALVQSRKTNIYSLKKHFDEGKAKILLATTAFWEGVDFDRHERLILVIPRLPFATPDDVLAKKYALKHDNPFYQFNLPMATLKLIQALGRVNRKEAQTSAAIILDSRLSKAPYGKKMRKALEKRVPVKSDEFNRIVKEVKEFLI